MLTITDYKSWALNDQRAAVALEGGNFEVQKMNTAIAGFKTGGVKSVTERLGGSEYRQFHRGGSDHVNV